MSGVPLNFYASRDVGLTQRLPSTSLLAIDSEDRYTNMNDARNIGATANPATLTPYSFTIIKNESIMNGFFTRLGVSEFVLPWTIPNVNPKTSVMYVSYNSGGGVVQNAITIVNGFYRPAELATAIQIAVRALDPSLAGFTIAYGVNNLPAFVYATNSATTIAFSPVQTNTNIGGPAPYYPYDAARVRQLFDLLGFTSNNQILALSGNGGTTFCQAINFVDVVCLQLTANQGLKDTMSQVVARDVLCRVYLTGNDVSNVPASSATFCPPGCAPFTVYRNFSQPKQIQWLPNQPVQSSLKFELYDDMGDILTTSDPFAAAGATRTNWSMSILVSEN